MKSPRKLLVVVDFDGTIIAENSTRVFEKCLVSKLDSRLLKHLLLALLFTKLAALTDRFFRILDKLLDVSDSRRLLVIPVTAGFLNSRSIEECVKQASRSLTFNSNFFRVLEALKVNLSDVVVLSNGFKQIIESFAEYRELHFKAIIASELSSQGYYVAREVRIPVKKIVLEKLSERNTVVYVTDALGEYLEFKKLEKLKDIKVLLVATSH